MTKPSPSSTSRRKAERNGRWAEALAGLYMKAGLFRIIARRVKTPVGEIDLIAGRGDLVVFVEVKARSTAAGHAGALESVNRHRIIRAAGYYIARNPKIAAMNMRFDVIFLAPWSWPRHVRDAFTAD